MSSFSPPARRGVGYCCASSGVAFVPLPAAPVVFHGVSCRRLPFGGSATFLAPVAGPAPAVELCCGVCGVLVRRLVFYLVPCSSSGACGWRSLPCRRLPLGVFCLFCHRVPDLLLLWWRRLGGNPSLILSVLLLRRMACRGLLGSAPWVRELPLGLCLLFG